MCEMRISVVRIVFVIALLAFSAAGQELYLQDYQSYELGSIFSQDADFTNQGLDNAVITNSYPVTDLGTDNQALLVSCFALSNGDVMGYAVEDVTGEFVADSDVVIVALDIFHRDAPGSALGYQDYFGLMAGGQTILELKAAAIGGSGVYSLNDVDIPGDRWASWQWAHYRFVLDYAGGNINLYIDAELRLTVDLPAGSAASDISAFKFGAGVNNNAGQTGACWFDNLTIYQMPGPLLEPQAVCQEDFEVYDPGDLPGQDVSWYQEADASLSQADMNVVSGQKLRLSASGPADLTNAPNYGFKKLSSLQLHQEKIEISFRMIHNFDTLYQGKMAGFGLLTDQGWVCRLHLLDFNGSAELNGVTIPFPAGYTWHNYTFIIDLKDDTVSLWVDDTVYGPVALLGGIDWEPMDLYFSSGGGLGWYCGMNYPKQPLSTWVELDNISVSQGPSESVPPSFNVEGAEMVTLIQGRPLFSESGVHIKWGGESLSGFVPFAAVVPLNTSLPLTVTLDDPGYLYALLWRWDYGMLREADMQELHGWQQVDAEAGTAIDFHDSLNDFRLYRRPLSAGSHQLQVTEYFGQWILVGFASDAAASGQIASVPNVNLSGGVSEHSVFDPGAEIIVQADMPIDEIRLYSMDGADGSVLENPFNAPVTPGTRYWLEVDCSGHRRIVPFVVGLGPVSQRGWRSDEFFPIHAYGGVDYIYDVNPARAGDLTLLAKMESGYNTTSMSRPKDGPLGDTTLPDALGMRRLYSTIGWTRYYMRDTGLTDEAAVDGVMWSISQHDPCAPEVLGYYIEDEPPGYTADRMALVEQRFDQDYGGTDLALTYCLIHGAEYWQTADTDTGNFRAYPYYNSLVGDIPGMRQMIHDTLLKNIDDWRAHNPDGDLWIILQTFGDSTWAIPSVEQVRLLINLSLARGVDGLTYYYWPWASKFGKGPALWPYVPADARYAEIARLNKLIEEIDFHAWQWLQSAEQTNPDLDVQILNNADGNPVAWVTNWDWLNTLTAEVLLPGDITATVTLRPGGSEIIDLCSTWLSADYNSDCAVNLTDFRYLAMNNVGSGTELVDLAEMASQWLNTAGL